MLGVAAYAQRGQAPTQAGDTGAGAGQRPAAAADAGSAPSSRRRRRADASSKKNTPQIPYDAVSLPLMPAGHTIGETEGVAINSKKHLFVYTRSGNVGPARGAQAAELFEFDETGKYVKEWGQNAYGFSFAHAIRFDKDDNLWVVDEGSNMVMKFNPQGLVTMVLGRKDEAIDYLERFLEEGRKIDAATQLDARRRRRTRRQLRPADRRRLRHAGQTSSSPTATTTRAWPSSTRTATS